MTKGIKKDLLVFTPIIVVILFVFWNLPQTFYQQDEWQVLGNNIVQGVGNIIKYLSPVQLFFSEGRVLARALDFIFFDMFRFTVLPVVIFAVFMHIINSFLVFYLAIKLTEKRFIAFFASIFFAVNSVSHQAVTWAAAITTTLPATSLVLLSILSYLKFLETNKKKWITLSFVFTVLSFLFKGVGIFLFIFFPVLYFFFTKRKSFIEYIKTHVLFITYGLLTFFFRYVILLNSTTKVGRFVTGGSGFNEKLLWHFILYSLTGFFQLFFPPLPVYNLATKITYLQYPFTITSPIRGLLEQTAITDMITIIGTLVVLLFIFFLNNIDKGKRARFLILSFSLIFLSFLPYTVLDRGASYMDSRYYYVGAIGAGMILGYVLNFFLEQNKRIGYFLVLFSSLLFFLHIKNIREDLSYQVETAKQRLYILHTIKETYPDLKDKNIFYMTGNQDYYISNNKIPMQQGMGYTLMLWYYDTGKIPAQFLEENFLWDIGSQSYKEIASSGFGYFSNLKTLLENYKKYSLSPNNIISFYWDAGKHRLIDTTVQTRKLLILK